MGNYVNCIEARLKTDLLAFFGLNAFDIDISYGTNLSAKGRVVDGKIELGTNLLKEYGYNDILSVVLHEVLHIKNDDNSWNNTPHKLSQTFVLENIPSEFNNFILNYAESFQTTSGAEWIYMDEITYNYINDPIYYKNEIKAYSQEIQMNSNVSKEYDIERKYMLWKSQRLYDIALANYNK